MTNLLESCMSGQTRSWSRGTETPAGGHTGNGMHFHYNPHLGLVHVFSKCKRRREKYPC
jgi:hypothetical protein